ncbi:MAG: helix-turn-helix domain-containing protein [Acidobacteriia bacterium]|nr:helix-turn-helix domain-containing protein [Terriglobia bacterium]
MQATRDKKAEAPVGEKIRSSKLSAEQVSRIKTLLAQGRMYMTELAREYGVTAATIARIARELSWRHVQAAPVETAELDASPADHAKQESTTPDNEL